MMIKYIKYNDKYRADLIDMINRLYLEDPEGEPMSRDKINATIAQVQEYPERLRIYMVLNEDEAAVGYAIIQLIWSNEWGGLTANIDEMYVTEDARGQGITTDFIKHVPELIPGVNRLTLEVTPSNEDAMRLYQRLGFTVAENRELEMVV